MAKTILRPNGEAGHECNPTISRGYAAASHTLASLWKRTDGATAVEYGLLAGLVAIGLAGGLGALADLVSLLFEVIGDEAADVSSAMNEE